MDAAIDRKPNRIDFAIRLLLVTALATTLVLLIADQAKAAPARYVYEMCDSALPGGGDAGVSFAVNPGVPYTPTDSCNQPGGSLKITETGPVSASFSIWSVPIAAPPGGTMASVTMSGAKCDGYQSAVVAFVLIASGNWPDDCSVEQQTIFQLNRSYGPLDIWLGCDGSKGSCTAGPWIYAHYFAVTEVDPVAPTLANLKGSLLSGNVLRGHQSLSVDAHDQGGGISNLSVSVNGLPAAQPQATNCSLAQVSNPSIIGTVAEQPTPCPTDTSAGWNLDTGAYPFRNGSNTVEVCASDFATLSDPNKTCSQSQTVEVDNSCAESPVAGGDQLSAQFDGTNADTITVGYGQSADVSGRLATNSGDPVSGATLCVKQQTLGVDPKPSSVGVVKTDASGHYSYDVGAGPNREIVIGYRHDANQVARDVRYFAHGKPTLHIAPRKVKNGHKIKIRGSVPGPSAGGRVVVLEASAPHSRRWFTFRKATSNANGVFRTRYRFTGTTRSSTYRLRAVIPNQAGYPWVGGAGKPVRIRVKAPRRGRH